MAAYPRAGPANASPGDPAWIPGVRRGRGCDDLVAEYRGELRAGALAAMVRRIGGGRVKFCEPAELDDPGVFDYARQNALQSL